MFIQYVNCKKRPAFLFQPELSCSDCVELHMYDSRNLIHLVTFQQFTLFFPLTCKQTLHVSNIALSTESKQSKQWNNCEAEKEELSSCTHFIKFVFILTIRPFIVFILTCLMVRFLQNSENAYSRKTITTMYNAVTGGPYFCCIPHIAHQCLLPFYSH